MNMPARIIDLSTQKECVSWGFQGENGATILVANIGEVAGRYPDGKPNVIFQRHDGHPYIHNFIIEGKNLFIELNSTDTQIIGKCEVQISWVAQGNRVVRVNSYRSFILPSKLEDDLPLTHESIVALDDLKSYVEEAKNLVSEAQNKTTELDFVSSLPAVGQSGRLYIDKSTSLIYFWDDDHFVALSSHYDEEFTLLCGGDAFFPANEE